MCALFLYWIRSGLSWGSSGMAYISIDTESLHAFIGYVSCTVVTAWSSIDASPPRCPKGLLSPQSWCMRLSAIAYISKDAKSLCAFIGYVCCTVAAACSSFDASTPKYHRQFLLPANKARFMTLAPASPNYQFYINEAQGTNATITQVTKIKSQIPKQKPSKSQEKTHQYARSWSC